MKQEKFPISPFDPQERGAQYIEDLATGYWYSEVLFTAVETGIFTLIEKCGKTAEEIAAALDFMPDGTKRFLDALCSLGLLHKNGPRYFNAAVSGKYLVKGKPDYQGESVLWRKELAGYWKGLCQCLRKGGKEESPAGESCVPGRDARILRYISAMDSVARTKVKEMLPVFEGLGDVVDMLDAGTGSGAIASGFLACMPSLKATVMDLPEILEYTREFMQAKGFNGRVAFLPSNILEPWPVGDAKFDIVMLSNIIHAYSHQELPHILSEASACLKPGGLLVIHDFFFEHYPEKAALFDLNMFINTYNGRVFSYSAVLDLLRQAGLHFVPPVALGSDTAIVIASKERERLDLLLTDAGQRLAFRIAGLGFRSVTRILTSEIRVADWADLKCRFGCDRYGSGHCPPNSPLPEKTRAVLKDYSLGFLLEGEPSGRDFQRKVLKAERQAFTDGYHKAFAYWAGPCSICGRCTADVACSNTRDARPSMEAAGIDVFETVRQAGRSVRTLGEKDDFVKYFALLLLE